MRSLEQKREHSRRECDRRRKAIAADPSYRDRETARKKEWRHRKPHYVKNQHYRQRYGISYEEYLKRVTERNGRCDVCGEFPSGKKPANVLAVDHSHITGQVRGMLCTRCNLDVGRFESTQRARIERYLEKYAAVSLPA